MADEIEGPLASELQVWLFSCAVPMFIRKHDDFKECQLYLLKGRLGNMEPFIKLS